MDSQMMLMLPLWYVVFLLSITAHEGAHALVARIGGDDTAYLGGQVTLNPVPHIMREPFGTVVIPLLTFFLWNGGWMMGWASAPYDPLWEKRYPKRAAMMALAGPVANLSLALIALLGLKVGIFMDRLERPLEATYDSIVVPVIPGDGIADGTGKFLTILLLLNLVLFLFNLIPLPPLDGASVLGGFIRPVRSFNEWLRRTPLGGLIGIVVAWKLLEVIFHPFYQFVVNFL